MPVSPSNFGIQAFAFPVVSGSGGCDYPAAGDVQLGVSYDSGGRVGTLALPSASQVLEGVGFGAGGSEFTGTLDCATAPAPDQDAYSPADVVRWLLVGLGLCSAPGLGLAWPCYTAAEPNSPDDAVTTFDTSGVLHASSMVTREQSQSHGVAVRVRSVDHPTGYAKAAAVARALVTDVLRETVTVGDVTYCVDALDQTSGILAIGSDRPQSERSVFTCNFLVTLRETS